MDTKKAKQIIAEAINLATTKGCYNLNEIKNILIALEIINQLPDQSQKIEA
jgi:hypothetical protein